MPDFEPIAGRYLTVAIDGVDHRIFLEEAGQGLPLLCLHTAGADSRQYRHLLNDAWVTERFRVIAFDMPWHGRSNPPDDWWLTRYRLTTAGYLATIRAVWQALGLDRPVVLGCSMGGAIVLKVAADYQDEITGIVGLESAAYAPGRYNELLHHPAIHGGELCASYTYGLNAPTSPEASRRENWWYYSQSGPGVYQGDVHYYSLDWDAAIKVRAGMLVDPSTLVYATVGYSYAAFSFNEDYWGTIYSDGDEVGGIVVGAGIETMLTDEIFLRAEGSATFYDTLDLKYEDTATPYSYWDISSTVLKASIGLGFKF